MKVTVVLYLCLLAIFICFIDGLHVRTLDADVEAVRKKPPVERKPVVRRKPLIKRKPPVERKPPAKRKPLARKKPPVHKKPPVKRKPVKKAVGSNASRVVGIYSGAVNTARTAVVSRQLGHEIYAMDFLDGTSWETISNPQWFLSYWKKYPMVWGVPVLPNSGSSLQEGATGAFNQYFKTLAETLVQSGQGSSVIRLAWEFNGNWFPWSACSDPSSFKAYWIQIVKTMRSVPGNSFKFEWNPTRGQQGECPPLEDFYPGNSFVDIIGLDVYDTEWAHYPGAVAEWSHMLNEAYGLNWLASFAAKNHKPLSFPEWGLGWSTGGMAGGGDNAYFVEHMAQFINEHYSSHATAWDYGSNPLPSHEFPEAKAAFDRLFHS